MINYEKLLLRVMGILIVLLSIVTFSMVNDSRQKLVEERKLVSTVRMLLTDEQLIIARGKLLNSEVIELILEGNEISLSNSGRLDRIEQKINALNK